MTFNWLIEELQLKGRNTPKSVIFCRTIEVCARLYCAFDMTLKHEGYIGGVIGAATCLFAMYHAKVTDSQKAVIMKSFSKVDGNCRVLFATVAFGMGINIPDIRRVINFGPSTDIEEYVQQSGRGGHDGDQCHALLYTYSGCTRGHVSNDMKEYIANQPTRVIVELCFSTFLDCLCNLLFSTIAAILVNPSVYVPAGAITVNAERIVLVLCAVCALQNVAICHLSQPCIMKIRRKMKTLTYMTYAGMSKTHLCRKQLSVMLLHAS